MLQIWMKFRISTNNIFGYHFSTMTRNNKLLEPQELQIFDRNLFDNIPKEILGLIFSFLLPSTKTAIRLSLVCKRFNKILLESSDVQNYCLWRWNALGFEKIIELEWVVQTTGKNWLWFAKCLDDTFNEFGFSWSLSSSAQYLLLGAIKYGKLNGWGISIRSKRIEWGEFVHNFHQGKGGFATLLGERYTGQFQNDVFEGVGTFIWSDGFEYNGVWKNGYPIGKSLIFRSN
jgi:hypothetical protein